VSWKIYGQTLTAIRTEILRLVTPTFALSMQLALRAMLKWLVPIADVVEEVNLVFPSK